MENPIKMDDLGVFPLFFGNTYMQYNCSKNFAPIAGFPQQESTPEEFVMSFPFNKKMGCIRSHLNPKNTSNRLLVGGWTNPFEKY